MNNTKLFTNKANFYAIFRPTYAIGFINELVRRGILGQKKTVADVGAGTGILSKQLASTGSSVIAVEPNEAMLQQAVQSSQEKAITFLSGTAENIPLQECSVDAIFVGQAFHWFDPILFREECKRVLKPNCPVVLVWNKKMPGEMEDERKKIVNRYNHPIDTFNCSWDERIQGIAAFFSGKYERISFSNDLHETREEFIGRTLSASHALSVTDSKISTYLDDWNGYFNLFQNNGIITIKNETIAFIGAVH